MVKTKKEKVLDLTFEGLKVGQVYRSKKPKLIGIFDPLVDDRQILHISQSKCLVDTINHGYTPEFEQWTQQKSWPKRFTSSEIDQLEFEKETGKPARNIEIIWDYMVQYDSPSVKGGKNFPSIPASKFIKWAEKNVTNIMPVGIWANKL